jgi:hypothetical protein
MRADWIRLVIAAAGLPLRSDTANNQFNRPWPDQVLDLVVVDGHSTIFQVARQRYPAFEAVVQSLGRGGTLRHKFTLGQHQPMQLFSDGHGCTLT